MKVDIPGQTTSLEIGAELTCSNLKRWLFSHDPYYRDAWRDISEVAGDKAISILSRLSFVMLKPDAIVARAIGATLQALASSGFAVVHCTSMRFNRHTIRELWRYELNRATNQRLDAIDLLLTATDSLLIFVEAQPDDAPSTAARLTRLKGPSLAVQRSQEHLRHYVGAGNGLLNYLHTPDEPADFIREIGVLLDRPERAGLLHILLGDLQSEFIDHHVVEEMMYRNLPHARTDILQSIESIETLILRHLSDESQRNWLIQRMDEARRAGVTDWQSVLRLAETVQAHLSGWDRALFAAACTQCNIEGIEPLVKA